MSRWSPYSPSVSSSSAGSLRSLHSEDEMASPGSQISFLSQEQISVPATIMRTVGIDLAAFFAGIDSSPLRFLRIVFLLDPKFSLRIAQLCYDRFLLETYSHNKDCVRFANNVRSLLFVRLGPADRVLKAAKWQDESIQALLASFRGQSRQAWLRVFVGECVSSVNRRSGANTSGQSVL
jgi:hypothetical protein